VVSLAFLAQLPFLKSSAASAFMGVYKLGTTINDFIFSITFTNFLVGAHLSLVSNISAQISPLALTLG